VHPDDQERIFRAIERQDYGSGADGRQDAGDGWDHRDPGDTQAEARDAPKIIAITASR